jgi:hypothetical protein
MNFRCPHCRRVVTFSRLSSDYVHNCSDLPRSSVLAKEDVPRVGTWVDADGVVGSSTDDSNALRVAGFVDKKILTESHVDAPARLPEYTPRGASKDTTRERNVYTYIDLKE